ncbi:class I SAM-dependent methyltransferase [Roseobacter sp. YSTF-M11]|uniref:Class I SAM-dependent methyltransferase n=1 Tax=Roseobacter insulae TaxID=2859783 RepID=A0A9X1FSS3_9RHOB|nr:class I SAM-dependent methyltransferase [Roseobacter insulae]MBW4707045.1 class I SAM-dependent methyltransferase [Roseobacter insulae]
MREEKPDLDTAYALETPDDNRALYAGWAETYDATFAQEMDFLMPGHVARLFDGHGGDGPVLDAGAGTGLVAGEILRRRACDIDAFDLSAEMLAVARSKGFYRRTIEGDLTAPLPFATGSYNAVVSSGTFTHGHVGPEALDELLRVAAPCALFVLTIKTEHYDTRGFAGKFAALSPAITGFETVQLPIYGPGATGDHKDDQGVIAVFRKA